MQTMHSNTQTHTDIHVHSVSRDPEQRSPPPDSKKPTASLLLSLRPSPMQTINDSSPMKRSASSLGHSRSGRGHRDRGGMGEFNLERVIPEEGRSSRHGHRRKDRGHRESDRSLCRYNEADTGGGGRSESCRFSYRSRNPSHAGRRGDLKGLISAKFTCRMFAWNVSR